MTVNEVDNLEDKKPSAFTLEAFYEQNGFNWRAGDLFFAGGGALLTKLKILYEFSVPFTTTKVIPRSIK
ncbi:hypothetical protein GOD37_29080 [Sinorhizobium medicae]|nr:hypothetical protein [Sinorhizobium medicae]